MVKRRMARRRTETRKNRVFTDRSKGDAEKMQKRRGDAGRMYETSTVRQRMATAS